MRQPSPTISYGPAMWISGRMCGLVPITDFPVYLPIPTIASLRSIRLPSRARATCLDAILQTRSGDWWMGGTNGLIHYAEGVRVQGAASEYQNVVWYKQNNPSAPLAHNRVRKIYERQGGGCMDPVHTTASTSIRRVRESCSTYRL